MAIELNSQYSIVDVIDAFKEFGDTKTVSEKEMTLNEANRKESVPTEKKNLDLVEPRKALTELLRALPRPTLRALDDLVRLKIGFPRMRRNGRRDVA